MPESAAEVVCTRIRTAITDGELGPRVPLVEDDLARRYGVSRTPVREALRRLQQEGLVEIVDRRGATVADYSLTDIVEIFTIREALEGIAARVAAERIDEDVLESLQSMFGDLDAQRRSGSLPDAGDRIHEEFLRACGNRRLLELVSVYKVHLARFHRTATTLPGRVEQSFVEHQRILDALRQRDPDKAERAVRDHIRSTRQSLVEGASR